jgi:hypothetical protein
VLELRHRLDGEGVFEALHARLQVLNLALLFGQEEIFYPVQALLDLADIVRHVVEPCVDHHGRVFDEGCQAAPVVTESASRQA